MKTKIILTLLLVTAGLFTSCIEVIDVDLNDSDPRLVIEANLNARTQQAEVRLTRSRSYFAVEEIEPVNNAIVFIDIDGTTTSVEFQEEGIYKAQIPVSVGQTATLSVDDGGAIYTAISEVPGLVELDSLTNEFVESNSLFEGGWFVTLHWVDPARVPNNYRVKISKNDSSYNSPSDLQVFEDEFFDGLEFEGSLFYFFEGADSVAGTPADRVKVELISISAASYKYYNSLSDIIVNQGGGSVAAPANPVTNLTGGALGLFNVFQADTMELMIGE